MSDAISNALARAREVAANQPAPVVNANPLPSTTQPVARPRSLEDALATAGTSVDSWIGMKDDQFTVDKNKSKVEEIFVTIKPSEVKFGHGVRYQSGGRPTYAKSYNGVTDARSGRNWPELVAQVQNMDPGCKGSYDLADIPMTLVNDLDGGGKPPVTVSAGTRIGYTTSITGYAPFMAWLSEAYKTFGPDADIPVRMFKLEKKGPTGPYTVIGFETAQQKH